MRRLLILMTAALLVLGSAGPVAADSVSATCAPVDLDKTFDRGYYGASWGGLGGAVARTVTWTATDPTVDGHAVTHPFTTSQLDAIQLAFDEWGKALSTITFQQVRNASAGIVVGWTGTNDAARFSYSYNYSWKSDRKDITNAYIQFTGKPNPAADAFLDFALSAIGNALGLGFISSSSAVDSAVKDSAAQPHSAITAFDRRLVRQLYAEEICTLDDRDALRLSSLQATIADLSNDIDRLNSDLEDARSALADYEAQIAALKSKLARICKVRPKPRGC